MVNPLQRPLEDALGTRFEAIRMSESCARAPRTRLISRKRPENAKLELSEWWGRGAAVQRGRTVTKMALETRKVGGNAYLYLYRRDAKTGRVRKVYVGRGPKADAAAAELAARKKCRADERQAVERAAAELRAVDVLMAGLDDAAALVLEATLLAAGYHRRNYGKWRKRRVRDGHGG